MKTTLKCLLALGLLLSIPAMAAAATPTNCPTLAGSTLQPDNADACYKLATADINVSLFQGILGNTETAAVMHYYKVNATKLSAGMRADIQAKIDRSDRLEAQLKQTVADMQHTTDRATWNRDLDTALLLSQQLVAASRTSLNSIIDAFNIGNLVPRY